ncbi:MAG: cysteine hydrolase family protein [Agrococcus casei]|uniref:Putative isochorismatase family protein n=1 Tax=Agrococcus casei LMG 22410 TaxID=1255656 RepID=A0A1R4EZD5_9MICO|nr:isochorismatase family cysteine hydrolase [Agrococcus casei]SJM48991.1 putative isochorismatase family protein [Agrococcus casei LMG 22410]
MTKPGDALLLIDLQEAFFESAPLAKRRPDLLSRINRLVEEARPLGIPVLLVTTEHSRDRSTWTLNMLDDDQGFLLNGDPKTAVVHELDTSGTTRIEKTRDSAWFGTDLHLRLRNLGVSRVILGGISTHGCIAQTARDAYAHNVRTVLVADAIADERRELHEPMLAQLEDDRQAEVRSCDQMIADWRRRQ